MNKHEQKWLEKYELAKKYYRYHENLSIPRKFKTINGYEYDKNGIDLGSWIAGQRLAYRKKGKYKITEKRIELLIKIGMIFENVYDNIWMEKYNLAKAYYEHYGNLEVPQIFKTINGIDYDENGIALGNWINIQRQAYKGTSKSRITKQQIRFLEDIGMAWKLKTKSEINKPIRKLITIYKIAGYNDSGDLIKIWNNYQELVLEYPFIKKANISSNIYQKTRNTKLGLRFYKYDINVKIPTKINKYIVKQNKRIFHPNQKGVIYKISNDKTKKVYIGQTSNFEKRKSQHFNSVSTGKTLLYKKMREIGQEHFTMEIIAEYPIEKLNNMEQYWIQYYDSYNNGYNSTPGGDVCSIPCKEAIPVLAYNKNTGIFFKEFSSISEAVKFLKLKDSAIAGIAHALDKETCSAQGFIWKRKINDNYPQSINSLKKTYMLLAQEKLDNVVEYIKKNIDNKKIYELKKELKSSFDKALQEIKIRDKKIYDKIIAKKMIEEKRFIVLINLSNKDIKFCYTQQEAADFIGQSQPNINKCIDKKISNNFIILSPNKYLKHKKDIEYIINVKHSEFLLNILNISPHISLGWQKKYELAKSYYEHYGNLIIPYNFKTINGVDYNEKGLKLGRWIATQRQAYKGNGCWKINAQQISLLENIEMIWNMKN